MTRSTLPTGLVIVAIVIVLWLAHRAEAHDSKAPEGDTPAAPVAWSKTFTIDANVYSSTFGEPMDQLEGAD